MPDKSVSCIGANFQNARLINIIVRRGAAKTGDSRKRIDNQKDNDKNIVINHDKTQVSSEASHK